MAASDEIIILTDSDDDEYKNTKTLEKVGGLFISRFSTESDLTDVFICRHLDRKFKIKKNQNFPRFQPRFTTLLLFVGLGGRKVGQPRNH